MPSFFVNGEKVSPEKDQSLLRYLRDELHLTAAKDGCSEGACGTCTVLIDGHAQNSCLFLTAWAEGKHILTVEGLRTGCGELHPVQQAFIDEAAVQCGFCTPGFIMTGVELVNTGKKYTREELREAISGHLCRCTGYENILRALEKVVGIKGE